MAPPTSSRPRSRHATPAKHAIETDLRQWPVVVHRVFGTPPVHEVDAYLHRASDILSKGRTHVGVVDCTWQGPASPYLRKAQLEWNREREMDLVRLCVGFALVLPREVVGFAKTTSLLVWSAPVPHEVFMTFEQAEAWALELVAARRCAG